MPAYHDHDPDLKSGRVRPTTSQPRSDHDHDLTTNGPRPDHHHRRPVGADRIGRSIDRAMGRSLDGSMDPTDPTDPSIHRSIGRAPPSPKVHTKTKYDSPSNGRPHPKVHTKVQYDSPSNGIPHLPKSIQKSSMTPFPTAWSNGLSGKSGVTSSVFRAGPHPSGRSEVTSSVLSEVNFAQAFI